ncbi:hypothetical protein Tco_0415422 [Tanacetum coccineum]
MEEVVKSEPCPAKASSISAEGESLKNKTRDSKFLVEGSYDIELNRRVIVRSTSRAFLDFKLSNTEDKKLELNLYNTSRVASDLEGATSSQASESTKETTQEKSKVFSCNYCKRVFVRNIVQASRRSQKRAHKTRKATREKKTDGGLAIWTPAATTLCFQGNNTNNGGSFSFGSPLVASSSSKIEGGTRVAHDFFGVSSALGNPAAALVEGVGEKSANDLLAQIGVIRPDNDQDGSTGGLDLNLKL